MLSITEDNGAVTIFPLKRRAKHRLICRNDGNMAVVRKNVTVIISHRFKVHSLVYLSIFYLIQGDS